MKGLKFLAVGAVLFLVTGLWAQTHHQDASGHKHHKAMDGQVADDPVMAQHEAMSAAMDARLDEKVKAMNAARGDQKVEAMAAVILELVAQRKAMRAHMMGVMTGHQEGHEMSCCAMMGGDGEAPDKPGDHSGGHPH